MDVGGMGKGQPVMTENILLQNLLGIKTLQATRPEKETDGIKWIQLGKT